MKYSLIDKLVCPNCRHFPLEIQVEDTTRREGIPLKCDSFCAKRGAAIEADDAPDKRECADCGRIRIETARLRCPKCNDIFDVEQGVPRMLHELKGTEGAQDKQNEIRARDEQAVKYDSLPFLRLLSFLELPTTLDLLDTDRTELVVELGAGTGRITQKVAEKAGSVIAVDFSVESLLRSKEKSDPGNISWLQADINRLPLREAIGDRLLSCQVFEHLPGASIRNMAIDEAARVVKPRGTFVISVYRDSWFWRLWGPKEGYHAGGIYYCRLSSDEFENMLNRQFSIRRSIPNLGLYIQIAKCAKKA